MDKPEVSPKRDCWICFNNDSDIVTTVKSDKMLKNCSAYLETPMFTKSIEKVTPVMTCCIYCYESVLQLTLLEEKVEKQQKEISDLSSLFSVNIMNRRTRFANKNYDEDALKLTPTTTDKYLAFPNNSDQLSDLLIEKVSAVQEVVENVTEELPSEFQLSEPETETDNKSVNLISDIQGHEIDDEDKDTLCSITNNSEDDIDVKYSYDQTLSKVDAPYNKSISPVQSMQDKDAHDHQQVNATSMTKYLLQCVAMPTVQIKRLGNSDSPKIADVAFEEIRKYEEDINNSNKRKTDSDNHIQNSPKRQKTFNKTKTKRGVKETNITDKSIPSGETPYKCPFCNESFNSSCLLKRHEKFHSEQRPYKCSLCSKSFFKPSHLKMHEMIHTGERPYECRFCSKSFYKSSDVKRHERMHTGEKPHKCPNCDKSFARKCHLKVHCQQVHGES